jgi:hypothetical protein
MPRKDGGPKNPYERHSRQGGDHHFTGLHDQSADDEVGGGDLESVAAFEFVLAGFHDLSQVFRLSFWVTLAGQVHNNFRRLS